MRKLIGLLYLSHCLVSQGTYSLYHITLCDTMCPANITYYSTFQLLVLSLSAYRVVRLIRSGNYSFPTHRSPYR